MVLQTIALPIELHSHLVREVGIEPTLIEPQSIALPLGYNLHKSGTPNKTWTCIAGLEDPYFFQLNYRGMVDEVGLEPTRPKSISF